MQPPQIDNSTKEDRLAYILEAWICLYVCESCEKYHILKGGMPRCYMPNKSRDLDLLENVGLSLLFSDEIFCLFMNIRF